MIGTIYYIVLYKDGAMMPTVRPPEKRAHQKGSRFFACNADITIQDMIFTFI